MHLNYYYYTLLQINVIRAAHNAYIIFQVNNLLTFYLPCFFLCLQFKQKICPQHPISDNDDNDDDTSVP